MNKIRTSSHICTHRVLKSFRSCVQATGASQILPDRGRVHYEECRRKNRLLHLVFANSIKKRHSGA